MNLLTELYALLSYTNFRAAIEEVFKTTKEKFKTNLKVIPSIAGKGWVEQLQNSATRDIDKLYNAFLPKVQFDKKAQIDSERLEDLEFLGKLLVIPRKKQLLFLI